MMPERRAFQEITNIELKNVSLTVHWSPHRSTLFRWLYEVCRDFRYSKYTHATAIRIVDLYVLRHGLVRAEYQLVGIAALFVAAKLEETVLVPIKEYAWITDHSCSEGEIRAMEIKILRLVECSKLKLPHEYINASHIQASFPGYTVEEKVGVLNCVIAALMERRTASQNMFVLFLEASRETEKILEGGAAAEDVQFYIDNCETARAVKLRGR